MFYKEITLFMVQGMLLRNIPDARGAFSAPLFLLKKNFHYFIINQNKFLLLFTL